MAKEALSALLVFTEADQVATLETALMTQSIHTRRATTCTEALIVLHGPHPPHLVFTDSRLADGDWADVLRSAARIPAAVNVIVVPRVLDTRLYLEALQEGAFDLITPPFVASDLAHVVRIAADDVLRRRRTTTAKAPLAE